MTGTPARQPQPGLAARLFRALYSGSGLRAGPGRPDRPAAGQRHVTSPSLPAPGDVARLTRFLRDHQRWSVFWDKRHGVWRAAEDDPDSALYTESRDVDTVIGYITAHS